MDEHTATRPTACRLPALACAATPVATTTERRLKPLTVQLCSNVQFSTTPQVSTDYSVSLAAFPKTTSMTLSRALRFVALVLAALLLAGEASAASNRMLRARSLGFLPQVQTPGTGTNRGYSSIRPKVQTPGTGTNRGYSHKQSRT